MPDALIRRWHEEATQLDALAAQTRAADQGGRFQIHGWETRAQALRDCATELWQLATADEEADHAGICSLPFGHGGGHWWNEEDERARLTRNCDMGVQPEPWHHGAGDPPMAYPGDGCER